MGKSYSLNEAFNLEETESNGSSDIVLCYNLRAFGSEDRLISRIFEADEVQRWKRSKGTLSLFLDSLDEALLRIDVLSALLLDEFDRLPIERLRLRIACRTGDWPVSLESGLVERFGSAQVQVLELLPLSRADVVMAVEASNIDVDGFLGEVDTRAAVPLASRPITLRFLLNTYSRDKALPASRTAVYEAGLRLLCAESNPFRRESKRTGRLSPEQILEVSSRIGAVTILANRFAVWTGLEAGEVPDEDVVIRELSGGGEAIRNTTLPVDEQVISDALRSGLFSSRGPHRIGWAHQSYGEFLAARYLVHHEASLPQILSLIISPGDPARRVIPQLQEVAGWLASQRRDLFDAIMETDPESLLRSDAATSSEEQRKGLVSSLLSLYASGDLLDLDRDVTNLYRQLKYEGMAADLTPYIANQSVNFIARRVAVDIAAACRLRELEETLVAVALDETAHVTLRANAIHAIERMGSDMSRRKLLPIAIGDAGDDPDDELRGDALNVLWPDLLSPEELFECLTPPKRNNLFGSYWAFLNYKLLDSIRPEGWSVALRWVRRHQRRGRLEITMNRLADQIMLRAWDHLSIREVFDAYAEAAVTRLSEHDGLVTGDQIGAFQEKLDNQGPLRRSVVARIIENMTDRDDWVFLWARSGLIRHDDLGWLIELLPASKGVASEILASIVFRVFDIGSAKDVDDVLLAAERSAILRAKFAGLIDPVDLESPEAKRQRERHRQHIELTQRIDIAPPTLDPAPTERVESWLNKAEAGDLDAWWRLIFDLGLEPSSTHYKVENELNPNVMALPGWCASDEDTRLRIVACARRYVQVREPATQQWIGKDVYYRPDAAAYKALRLLQAYSDPVLEAAGANVCAKWIAVILATPTWNNADEGDASKELACIAYRHAPTATISNMKAVLRAEYSKGGLATTFERFGSCWDAALGNALTSETKRRGVPPTAYAHMLAFLLERDVSEAITYARSIVEAPIPTGRVSREKAAIAASLLISRSDRSTWPLLWALITREARFAKTVISKIAAHRGNGGWNFLAGIEEQHVAELFVWIWRYWPHRRVDQNDHARFLGPADNLTWFRDGLLRHLESRGTFAAGRAMEWVARELPEIEWLKWFIQATYASARRKSWAPPSPEHLLSIVRNSRNRLVQGGSDLLDLIVESLTRLQLRLQGTTPFAFALWDKIGKNKDGVPIFQPKEEASFTDFIKLHLEGDLRDSGVVLNREVQIRAGSGVGVGESTDLHIDAVKRSGDDAVFDIVSAIVETKGCWNPELKKAMKTQLADRYLKDNHITSHGLYVVGWYNCDQWDRSDYRWARCPKSTVEEMRNFFDQQARDLTNDDREIRAFVLNTALR